MAAFVAGGRPHNERTQIDRYATLTPQTFAVRACQTIALSELKITIQSERFCLSADFNTALRNDCL